MIEFNGNIGVEFRKLAQNKNSEVMIYGLDRDYSYSDVDVYSDAIAKKIVNKCKKRHIRVGLYLNHSPITINMEPDMAASHIPFQLVPKLQ